jgi:hypothetical protein
MKSCLVCQGVSGCADDLAVNVTSNATVVLTLETHSQKQSSKKFKKFEKTC